MKKMTFCIISILLWFNIYAQDTKVDNPVYNSIITSEKAINDLTLISNYYTLENNINNSNSMVYISNEPTLDEIEEAATANASDFFLLTKENKMVVMISLVNSPKREFMVIIMKNNKQKFYSCKLVGDIAENRASELITNQYDPEAYIENNILFFNKKTFRIINNNDIEEAVLELIKSKKLDRKKPSDIVYLSQGKMKSYIISETKEGGSFDFFSEIKGKENNGVQVMPGVFSTYKSVALYQWGRACFDLGVNTIDDALEIYTEINGKPLYDRDKSYIKMGFYNEWEKN